MTKSIYRYTIPVQAGTQPIQWPKGGEIRRVGGKRLGYIDFWVEFEEGVTDVDTRYFVVVKTGAPIPDDYHYVETVIQSVDSNDKELDLFGGAVVWHVYERNI